jgi:hypothetical protein
VRGSRRSVTSDNLLEQRGRARFRVRELETYQVPFAARYSPDVADAGLQRAEIVVGSEANDELAVDIEGPSRHHQCAALTQILNLDRRVHRDGPWEPPDDLEPDALTTVCHVFILKNPY